LLAHDNTLFNNKINYLAKNRNLLSFNNSNRLLVGCLRIENGEQIIAEGTIENTMDAWNERYKN